MDGRRQQPNTFGIFWRQGAREAATPGRLFCDADGIKIQVFRDIREDFEYQQPNPEVQEWTAEITLGGERDSPQVIHGQLRNPTRNFTALNCQLASAHEAGEFGEYIFEPRTVVHGEHTSGLGQEFAGVRVRLKHLDEWADLSGFSGKKNAEAVEIKLSAPAFEPVSLADGALLSIHQEVVMAAPTSRGGTIGRTVWLQVDGLSGMTLGDIDRRILVPLRSLATLCSGMQTDINGVELTIDGTRWLDLEADWISRENPRTVIQEPIVGLQELGLLAVAQWLDKVEKLGPLPVVVSRYAAGRTSVNVEIAALELTTVAEGLHARLFDDEKRLHGEVFARLETKLMTAVENESKIVQTYLKSTMEHFNNLGYPARLKQLAGKLDGCELRLTGRANKWASVVSDVRNGYAHRTSGFLSEERVNTLVTVHESLLWLLRCILLIEVGVEKETIASRLPQLSGYHYFLSRAKQNLPKVYENES